MQSAELRDLRSAILSDLVGADIKSDTADIIHSQRKALKMQNAKCRVQNCGTCGQQFISDLVYADFKSDTANKMHPFTLPQGKSYMAPSLRDSKALSEREGGTALAVTGGCF